MKPFFKDIKIYIAVGILLLLPLTLSFPAFLNKFDKKIEVPFDESSYKGIKLKNMDSGDSVDIEFKSNADLRLYLLTEEESDQFRNITYYGEVLEDPITSGYFGKEKIVIEDKGDYELIFWNDTFPLNTEVECEGQIHRERDQRISKISTISLVLLSLFIFSLIIIQRINNRRK